MSFFGKALQHKEIYPLLGACTFAGGMAIFCGVRACLVYPEVTWNHKSNPEPWNDIKQTDQVKMYQTYDYITKQPKRPEASK
ncbi:NADH dehydrogenase [ubiquinone] 1 alpha subcomplex subunit 4-like 2 [Clytia hemisphaerica]|uniref:NADH dehydrogenase [ubiquinone] 1 alpha subcomplex subunit 4-like 2 n=1 Tax=Clytia hemisphaerica TaxID=252671 RepID=UPI0034D546C8